MYLVLLETSGNQRYIFATNKLCENIGASELTYRAGVQWVLEAVHESGGPNLWHTNPTMRATNILDPKINRPLESGGFPIEVVLATSGKAILLVATEELGKHIITTVTARALTEAPGLDVCGVVMPFDWEQDPLGEVLRRIHRKHQEVHARLPSPTMRFLRLPIVAACKSSGLPASRAVSEHDIEDLSQASLAKRGQLDEARKWPVNIAIDRMETMLDCVNHRIRLPRNLQKLEEYFDRLEWVAVVHIDGNGFGRIFHRFDAVIEQDGTADETPNRHYIRALREFSSQLDACSLQACRTALTALAGHRDKVVTVPVVPLILGGDDVTVLCDGQCALTFARSYLAAFEQETRAASRTRQVAGRICAGADYLSGTAGISITDPHFPFFTSYELAEALITKAKTVKDHLRKDGMAWPCSALDFHVLHDSSVAGLDQIRERLEFEIDTQSGKPTQVSLYTRPFVLTELDQLPNGGDGWAAQHHWCHLQQRVGALHAKDPATGERKLPSSQMHELRAGLHGGPAVADARYRLIAKRYDLKDLAEDQGAYPSLFWWSTTDGTLHAFTRLLDAMTVANGMFIDTETDVVSVATQAMGGADEV